MGADDERYYLHELDREQEERHMTIPNVETGGRVPGDFFSGDYLKASDIGPPGVSVKVTIGAVKVARFNADEGRPAEEWPLLIFIGKKKGLVCKSTNGKALTKALGDSFEDWIGRQIILTVAASGVGDWIQATADIRRDEEQSEF